MKNAPDQSHVPPSYRELSLTDRAMAYVNSPDGLDYFDPVSRGKLKIYLGSVFRDLTKGDRDRGLLLLNEVAEAYAARALSIPFDILTRACWHMYRPEGINEQDPIATGNTSKYLEKARLSFSTGKWEDGIRTMEDVVKAWVAYSLSNPLISIKQLFDYANSVRGTTDERSGAELIKSFVLPRAVQRVVFMSGFTTYIMANMEWTTCPHQIAPKEGAVSAAHPILTLDYSDNLTEKNAYARTPEIASWLSTGIKSECPNTEYFKADARVEPPRENDMETELLVHQNGALSSTSSFYDPDGAPKEQTVLTIVTEDKAKGEKCISEVGGQVLEVQYPLDLACLWNLEELPHNQFPDLPEKRTPYHFTVSCGSPALPNVSSVENGRFENSPIETYYAHNPEVNLEWTAWGGTQLRPEEQKDQPAIITIAPIPRP